MTKQLTFCLLFLSLSASLAQAQNSDYRAIWAILGDVTFDKQAGEDALTLNMTPPTFGEKVLALDGKEVTIEGYVLPLDFQGNYIVISANPFASCFFCGGAGPETVMEVYLTKKKKIKSKTVTVRGTLALNKGDLEHLTYILKNAVIVNN